LNIVAVIPSPVARRQVLLLAPSYGEPAFSPPAECRGCQVMR
jgi:hypothetical protein